MVRLGDVTLKLWEFLQFPSTQEAPYIEMTFRGMVTLRIWRLCTFCKPGEILQVFASCGGWKTQVLVATATVWNRWVVLQI